MMKVLRVALFLSIVSSSSIVMTCILLIVTCVFLRLQVEKVVQMLQVSDCHEGLLKSSIGDREFYLDPPEGQKEIDASSGTGTR